MAAEPLVSVIIATNRASEFLDEALTSIEQQTYPNWEVVIVDDGNPSPEALESIVGKRKGVRVIRQDNSGVSIARNVAIDESRGDYVGFLDDDDAWLPDRMALQVAALEADPSAVLAYGRVASIDPRGRILSPATQRGARDRTSIFDGTATPQFQTITVRRRNLVRVGGFHSGLVHSEDLDLILRLAREGDFLFLDEELALYRQHGANNSSANRYLTASIDGVVRLHLVRAREEGDGTAEALRARFRANGRYAFWTATRTARRRGIRAGASDLLWAVRFAPLAPADAVLRRVSRRRRS